MIRMLSNLTLGLWLIATGLIALLDSHFRGMHFLMATLALIAGVLAIVRR